MITTSVVGTTSSIVSKTIGFGHGKQVNKCNNCYRLYCDIRWVRIHPNIGVKSMNPLPGVHYTEIGVDDTREIKRMNRGSFGDLSIPTLRLLKRRQA